MGHNSIKTRVEALERQLTRNSKNPEEERIIERIKRLTVEECEFLVRLMEKYDVEDSGDLVSTVLEPNEHSEWGRLQKIMADPGAPTGQLRTERLQLGTWLESFEAEKVEPHLLPMADIIARRAERFIRDRKDSSADEDTALVERCHRFLFSLSAKRRF